MTFSTLGTDTTTNQPVYLYKTSRTQGLYIVGLQGMGKSGLIENLIIDDIKQGIGVCVLDPHGELIDHVIARLPGRAEEEKVIFLDLAEEDYFFGLNLFECADPTNTRKVSFTRSQVLHVFEKAFGISMAATPRIYDYLFNSAYTLIANPRQSLLEIPLLFTDTCRQKLLSNVSSAEVHKFWSDYKQFSQQKQDEEARELLRRLNDLSDDPLRFIVGQSQSTIHLQKIMDEGKILLVKLDRRLEQATSLIGSMIVALILNASATRTTYKHFHLYADEFQRFATEDFATLLEEARKAGIGITMAHQNRAQLELSNKQADSQLKARTLNVGSLVVFRVPTDAVALAGQFDTTPPPAELRREETLTPVSNPFDWLVSHTHTNPVVNRFVDNHLRIIHHTLSSGWGYQKDILLEFNSFLYRAMTSSDPLSMLCEKSSLSFLLKLNDSYPIGTYYFGETVIAGLPELESHLIQSTVRFSSSIPNQLRHSDKPEYVPVSMPILAARRRSEGGKIDYSVLDETMLSRFAAMIRAIGDNEFHHASDQFARPAQLKLKKLIETYITAYQIAFEKHGGIIPTRKFSLYGYLEPEEEAKRCEQEFPRWMTEERAQFETFIKEFRDFILALAKKPITAGSGIYEMKPVGQMTSDEMKNRIEKELIHLPIFTARVKLTDGKDRIVEYTMQTLDPKKQADKPLYGQLLNDRIERIKLHNRTVGYTRPRQEVEVEIRMRQEALIQAQQPQKTETKPQEMKRKYLVEPQPVQPIAASDSQLDKAIAALTEERFNHEMQRGSVDPSLSYSEWYTQEVKKLLKQG